MVITMLRDRTLVRGAEGIDPSLLDRLTTLSLQDRARSDRRHGTDETSSSNDGTSELP